MDRLKPILLGLLDTDGSGYSPPDCSHDIKDLPTGKLAIVDQTFSQDGHTVRYQIDGSLEPDAFTLVLIPKTLTTLHIWDPVVKRLVLQYPQYRILRYDIRGYTSESIHAVENLTIDLLVQDLRALLSHLRIYRIDVVVGIGLGATIALGLISLPLQAASREQRRENGYKISVGAFVGIAFPIWGSPSHTKATAKTKHSERSEIADQFGMVAVANDSVARWFGPGSRGGLEYERIRSMVAGASVEGMRRLVPEVVRSIESATSGSSPFNTAEVLRNMNVPGLFVCGAQDLYLPSEMATYPDLMQPGLGKFAAIKNGARLAICESPQEFVDIFSMWIQEIVSV